MSDPARVEALVLAELEATGKSKRGGRAKGSGGKSAHETNGVADGAIGSPRVPKPTGMYKVSRAVQRAAPSTMSTVSVDEDDADGLRRAAVHHWRARMMVKLSSLYSDAAWEAQEKPRKFFIKHRGVRPVARQKRPALAPPDVPAMCAGQRGTRVRARTDIRRVCNPHRVHPELGKRRGRRGRGGRRAEKSVRRV